MGSERAKSSTEEVNTQTTAPQMTEEEKQMQQLQLQQYKQTVGPQTQAQLSGLNLVNQLLTGQIPGGFYQKLGQGISPEAIGNQATKYAFQNMPGFQSQGIYDSGIMAKQISRGIANEVLYPAEQFNIGSLQNLMNMALSGQAQVQQPIQQGNSMLYSQLAGLRPVTQQGTSTQTSSTPGGTNPFLKVGVTAAGALGGFAVGGPVGALYGGMLGSSVLK